MVFQMHKLSTHFSTIFYQCSLWFLFKVHVPDNHSKLIDPDAIGVTDANFYYMGREFS